MNFQDLGLCEAVLRAVLMEGYEQATPIQTQAIGPVLEGRDVIGCAQTGTGKTAAFALPLLHRLVASGNPPKGTGRKIRTLVLASTRELASQIRDSFATYGHYTPLRMAAIFGGVSQAPQERVLKHGIDILIATPGRLLDLIHQGFVDLAHVESLVLDEADRMLDMGFLPAIREVLQFVPKVRQTLLFSATMPPPIVELANTILNNPVQITIEPKQKATELVQQSVFHVAQKQKIGLLVSLIKRYQPGRAIVFTRTKHGADRVVRHLTEAGIRADAIHSNKSQNKRQRILDEFKWTNPPILVATDIAARGIDVDEVSHVFNYDMPQEPETYVHRIGRSGRAGATGMAISFCDPDEKRMLKAIETLIQKRIPLDPISNEIIASIPAKKPNDRNTRTAGAKPQGDREPSKNRSPKPHAQREDREARDASSSRLQKPKGAPGKTARPHASGGKRPQGTRTSKPMASKKPSADKGASLEGSSTTTKSFNSSSKGPKKGSIGKKHRRSRSGQRS